MIRITVFIFIVFAFFTAAAQDPGEIISPKPGDTVTDGELLIVFRFNPDLQVKTSTIDIIIDRMNFNYLMKVKRDKITVLITGLLSPGTKQIKVKARDSMNKPVEMKWEIEIRKKLQSTSNADQQALNPSKKLKVNADVESISRVSNLDGEGAFLRQEPPDNHSIRLKSNIRYGKFNFPLKLYLTNNETPGLPPRNRYMVGVQTDYAGFTLGDVNPSYNRLMLPGTRIRGMEGYVRYKKAQLSLVYGTLNRAVEGMKLFYNSLTDAGLPPLNLEVIPDGNDSLSILQGYYNTSGIYRRNVLAGKLSLGSPNTNNWFHLVFLKSTDDTTSIDFGKQASQNFTAGMEVDYRSKNKKLHLYTGISVAFTTRDIRNGIASHDVIESMYDIDLPIDLYKVRRLIIYNTTTNQATFKHTPFMAFYILPEYKTGEHRISGEFKRIGTTYQSFGNPFLTNDRLIVGLSERSFLMNKKLLLMARLRHQNNNLNKTSLITYNTELAELSANYLLKEKWPKLTGGYRYFERNSIHKDSSGVLNKYRILNYRGGFSWMIPIKSFENNLHIEYSRNVRKIMEGTNSMSTHSIRFGLGSNHKTGLNAGLDYDLMIMTNDTVDFARNNSYSLRIGYARENKKLGFYLRVGRLSSYETWYYPRSVRDFAELSLNYEMIRNLELNLLAGNTLYNEDSVLNLDYNELWLQFGIRYQIRY